MSARDEIFKRLAGAFVSEDRANELIDAYAHELAEKIRNSEELRDLTDDHMNDCNAAADLIDPEVTY